MPTGAFLVRPHVRAQPSHLRDLGIEGRGDKGGIHNGQPRLSADPLCLAQISHNLLSNAIKFTAEGTVRLVVGGARTPDDRLTLKISVADSAIGISPEDQARLFQPFTQIDDCSTRRSAGPVWG